MSKRSWGTGFAIGLGLGVGLALFFLVWAVPEFRSPSLAEQYYQNWQATSDPGQNQNPDDAHFWVRELHGWAFAEDSLAQWLMAMLGFAATAISLYALIWLRRTWDQTKRSADAAWKAVNVTREIGEAQVRAYISSIGGTFSVERDWIQFFPRVVNRGQSPAKNVTITAVIVARTDNGVGPHGIRRFKNSISKESDTDCGTIQAGSDFTGLIVWPHTELGPGAHDAICDGGHFSIDCRVTWRDVFGRDKSMTFSLYERGLPENSPISGGEFVRVGNLDAFNREDFRNPNN